MRANNVRGFHKTLFARAFIVGIETMHMIKKGQLCCTKTQTSAPHGSTRMHFDPQLS